MSETQDFSSFFNDNRRLIKEYLDTRLEIFRLQLVRGFSRSAGLLIWLIISLFLLFLFFIFCGIVLGFWLSSVTGSYVKGFGLTTLSLLVVIVLLALLRRVLFVNPIIRVIIRKTANDDNSHDDINKND